MMQPEVGGRARPGTTGTRVTLICPLSPPSTLWDSEATHVSKQVVGNALGYTTTPAQIHRRKWKLFCPHYLPAQLLAPGTGRVKTFSSSLKPGKSRQGTEGLIRVNPWVCLPTGVSKATVSAIKQHKGSWLHLLATTSSKHHPR